MANIAQQVATPTLRGGGFISIGRPEGIRATESRSSGPVATENSAMRADTPERPRGEVFLAKNELKLDGTPCSIAADCYPELFGR